MNWVERYLKNPHGITALLLLGVVYGFIGFRSLPLNLFPDANYPQVAILLIWQGASAEDMADKISRPVEKELGSLGLTRRVSSTVRDETAAVTVEFDYAKDLDSAVTDANTALNRILPSLPSGLNPPRIFRISDATQPVQTLAVTAKPGSGLSLTKVRQLCDNQVQEALLRVQEIADVEVFGGYVPEIELRVDKDRLASFNFPLDQVIASVYAQNRNIPIGRLIRDRDEVLIRIAGERDYRHELGDIVIGLSGGSPVYLKDVAEIRTGHAERNSFYRGNGKPAIGLNVLRPENGHVTTTLNALEKSLPGVRANFVNLDFEMTDTQGELIRTSVSNLITSLRDAVILTVAVIFLMLARIRMTLLAMVSIPFTFLLTFAGMKLLNYELNIVTMTAIILAVGLLVDDAIVVIENIDKHAGSGEKSAFQAAVDGTREIFLADFGGTATTLAVLLPIMFVGGYTQQILRPLTVVLSLALLSSYLVSITVIPLLASKLMKPGQSTGRLESVLERFLQFWIVPLQNFFISSFRLAAGKWGFVIIPLLVILLPISLRQMSLAGRDLMPAMDTGIVKVSFEIWPGSTVGQAEKTVAEMEKVIRNQSGYLRMSTVAGSEPKVISFGAERTSTEGVITVHFANRFQRPETIWEIEADLRKAFAGIYGLKSVSVYDYGATPLSAIAAPVDVMISGPDPEVLNHLALEVEERLLRVKGLTSIKRTWDRSKPEIQIDLDEERLVDYGLTIEEISRTLTAATTGNAVSSLRVQGQDGYGIRLRFDPDEMKGLNELAMIQLAGPRGPVPLQEIADFNREWVQTRITRQNLEPCVNILGYRADTAITHLQNQVDDVLADMELPAGYSLSQEGEIKHMKTSFGRLGSSLGLAVILLYFSLTVIFISYFRPLIIMSAIPLAFIGVPWGMILMNRHFCMPAAMGMILLTGIVVNNSILLLDFIETSRREGKNLYAAVEEAIRRRTRPILMTALSTIAGMLPIAAEMAVGLERLSPLAVVAIAGLLVSTFLTLAYVPVIYVAVESLKIKVASMYRSVR